MPVTDAEKQEYSQFLLDIAKELQSIQVNFDQTLWHYTTGSSLLAILNSSELYATQVSCLNDSTEIVYGRNLLRKAYVNLQAEGGLTDQERKLLAGAVNYGGPDSNPHPNAANKWFVTCFSEERDDLSQWRAYSGGEDGFAIGFRAGGFFKLGARHNIVRVNYDGDLHRGIASRIAYSGLEFFRAGLSSRSGQSAEQWPGEFIEAWDLMLSYLAPIVKHPAFRNEKEFRIIHEVGLEDLGQIKFIQKKSLLSRHLPLTFPLANANPPVPRLPITEILIGPSRHKEISAVSVATLLNQKGYGAVRLQLSTIPYQST